MSRTSGPEATPASGPPSSHPAGALVMVLGGLIAAIGTVVEWGTLSAEARRLGARQVTGRGIDIGVGRLVLALGIVAVVCGAVAWFWRHRGARGGLAALGLAAGFVAAAIAAVALLAPERGVIPGVAERAAEVRPGADPERLEERLRRAHAAGRLSISPGIGLYLSLGGGVVIVIGSALMLARVVGGREAPGLGTAAGAAAAEPTRRLGDATEPLSPPSPPPPPAPERPDDPTAPRGPAGPGLLPPAGPPGVPTGVPPSPEPPREGPLPETEGADEEREEGPAPGR